MPGYFQDEKVVLVQMTTCFVIAYATRVLFSLTLVIVRPIVRVKGEANKLDLNNSGLFHTIMMIIFAGFPMVFVMVQHYRSTPNAPKTTQEESTAPIESSTSLTSSRPSEMSASSAASSY